MSVPLRNLPVMQNWDCQSCGDCCRIEAVITEEEKRRIEALDLTSDPEIAAKPWFTRVGRGSKNWKLRHRPDGCCVFLTTANRCRIQERHGADSKPFVCRLFPFVIIPAGNHWRVGVHFSCPSAAANQGRPLVDAAKDLEASLEVVGTACRQIGGECGASFAWSRPAAFLAGFMSGRSSVRGDGARPRRSSGTTAAQVLGCRTRLRSDEV